MTLDPIAIATIGYVCRSVINPISRATHGYVCPARAVVGILSGDGGSGLARKELEMLSQVVPIAIAIAESE